MKCPHLMGIVNVTPDSFSGDGQLGAAALAHAHALIAEGADSVDVGAESTRPGATPLGAEAEWRRLEQLFMAPLAVQVSVDTRHAATARQALENGATIINDVNGLRDPAMVTLLTANKCDIVLMHALTIPADAQVVLPVSADPLAEILAWKHETILRVTAAGIDPNRIIWDPGLGFGKTPEQSLALVLNAATLVDSGGRWLFGHSRKSFLALFTDAPAGERDSHTLLVSALLAHAGVHYLRVHNIAAHRKLFECLCT